ncbi:MAG: DsbA family protein [Gammaproteobacteria bacterium]|nr:DsbA family protein [Gammaproteobacteria bacterium]
MNRRALVIGTIAAAVGIFSLGAWLVQQNQPEPLAAPAVSDGTPLVRPYAPIIGEESAPVTIVEFFDPACEACRAFHPIVKSILDEHPGQVRVVLRYAAFHHGSDEAVKILEAARLQDMFEPVMEALLEAQPQWANHGAPQIDLAWKAAAEAGLDVTAARAVMDDPEIVRILEQDAADVQAVGVKQTPTFFVDGRPMMRFGADELREMVKSQVEAKGT